MGRTLLQVAAGLIDVHARPANLSVIVPVGPDDSLDHRLQIQLARRLDGVQLRLVCADSDERSLGAFAPDIGGDYEIMRAARGRAAQQNAGACGATGDWLWFLHADSVLSAESFPAVYSFMHSDRAAAGYHELRFLDGGPAAMRLTEVGVWLRSHLLGLPFGDQGLLMRRAVFEDLDGFNERLDRGEDHDLVWRLRHAGFPLRPVGAMLYTSARKYTHAGWCATTFEHTRETVRQAWRFSRVATIR